MAGFILGLAMGVKALLTDQKALPKWIERASTADIQQKLTKLYLRGNEEENTGRAFTATELATLKQRFESMSLAETGLQEYLAFYAGYPFQPLLLPLSYEDVLRAVVQLAGKDEQILDERSLGGPQGQELIRQGRTTEDKLGLMFAALAGGSPTQSNILDVLMLLQPRPHPDRGPAGHTDLRPMATRLAPKAPISATKGLSIPKGKLVEFLKVIDLTSSIPETDEIDFETFNTIVDTSVFMDAVYRKVRSIFLKA